MFNYNHDCPFEIFLTNLGKYNDGELIGEWVKFPTNNEELRKVMNRIGIGSVDEFGQPYEEWFITDYDCYVDGIYHTLGEYENLDELNFLANKLSEMNEHELAIFNAACVSGEYTSSLKDLINLAHNLDTYDLYEDINNDYDLGYYYIEEAGIYNTSQLGNLANYFDYEKFGRDVRLEEGGEFTDKGYIRNNNDSFVEVYTGNIEDIPEEYRIMSKGIDMDIEYNDLNETNQREIVYGYVYNSEGMHNGKIPFENTPANIASFIWNNRDSATVITDSMDNFLVSSMQGGFLDRLATPRLREEVLEQILPLQLGEREANMVGLVADKNELTAEAVAAHLTKFVKDFDTYEFLDQELYEGYLYDNNVSDLKKHNTKHIKEYLNNILEDNEDKKIEQEVNELLKDIDIYEAENPIESQSRERKIKMT